MAKTKADWIKEINSLDKEALGELTQDDLLKMNIGQLKMLKKEMEEELGKVQAEGEMLAGGIKEDEEFVTMCGSDFDAKKSGSCYKQCSKDFPEAFASCVEHFKAKPVVVKTSAKEKAKAKAPSGSGKTIWNHIAKSQAGKIDECILTGFPMTLKEIADYAEGKEVRTMGHLKHLVFDWNVKINFCKRATEEGVEETVYFWADKNPDMTGAALEGKSAYNTALSK